MNQISKPEVRHELPSVEQYLALRAEAGLSPMSLAGRRPGFRGPALQLLYMTGSSLSAWDG